MGLLDFLLSLNDKDKNINEFMKPNEEDIFVDELEEDDFHFEDEE